MRSLVDLQVLRSRKHLAASLERTRKRLLAGMHANMIDQLVLGLERSSIPLATHPEASMLRTLRSADMLHRQMPHDLAHRSEHLAAMLASATATHCAHRMAIRIHPHADQLLFERGSRSGSRHSGGRGSGMMVLVAHVSEEGARRAGRADWQIGEIMMVVRVVWMDGGSGELVGLMGMGRVIRMIVVGGRRDAHSHRMLMERMLTELMVLVMVDARMEEHRSLGSCGGGCSGSRRTGRCRSAGGGRRRCGGRRSEIVVRVGPLEEEIAGVGGGKLGVHVGGHVVAGIGGRLVGIGG